jgi:hypothetical protein
MENTIENAAAYARNAPRDEMTESIMVRYASDVLYAATLRPATVSEEEIKERLLELESFCKDNGYRPAYIEQAVLSFSEGIEWALGRQTRIVLPSYRVTRDIESSAVNRCLDKIKQLNPSATFVTEQK